MRMVTIAVATALLAGSTLAGAAVYDWQAGSGFFYAPVPRWAYDPEHDLDFNEKVCPLIRQECPQLKRDAIEQTFAYDELYDARGHLAGVRLVKGSGCAPLDESVVLGQREFKGKFHKDDQPDLDGVQLELGRGADPAAVRIVKRVDNLQFSAGCSE